MSLSYCSVCGLTPLQPIFEELIPEERGGPWYRCGACGSDTSELTYPDVVEQYQRSDEYADKHPERPKGVQALKDDMRANLDWFKDHIDKAPNKDFLDIGCCEGAGLLGFRERGWGAFGFDVSKGSGWAAPGNRVVIAPFFHRWLFADKKFGGILVREVIEHVDGWRHLLHECYHALAPGGLLQVQTPRPTRTPRRALYERQHLRLFSPAGLEAGLASHGFNVLDAWFWEIGQAWLCQRRG